MSRAGQLWTLGVAVVCAVVLSLCGTPPDGNTTRPSPATFQTSP